MQPSFPTRRSSDLLGERESGTQRLEEAVDAYRAALRQRTPGREPLDSAGTQNNLGNALGSLGEREAGTARLNPNFRGRFLDFICHFNRVDEL